MYISFPVYNQLDIQKLIQYTVLHFRRKELQEEERVKNPSQWQLHIQAEMKRPEVLAIKGSNPTETMKLRMAEIKALFKPEE